MWVDGPLNVGIESTTKKIGGLQNMMKCRCPHCGNLFEGVRPNESYTCKNCGTRFRAPRDHSIRALNPKYADERIPLLGVLLDDHGWEF